MAKILDLDLLTYIVNGTPTTENIQLDTTTRKIKIVAGGNLVAKDGLTGQCLYSKLKSIFQLNNIIIQFPLPVNEMIHDESLELINGWTFADETSLKMIRDCGVATVAINGNYTAMYACIVTLGNLISGAPYFTQSTSSSASTSDFTHINLGTTFGVNELIQIYSDPDADLVPVYDYRNYFKVFLREQGKTYDESSNTDIGYPELTYKKYNFPITHSVDANITVDDVTLDAYVGMSITWYALAQSSMLGTNGPYNYHVIIEAASKTHDEIYSWVQRQLRKSTDIDADVTNVRIGRVASSLVFMDGSVLKTRYQTGVGGIHVNSPSSTSFNNIMEADDTQTLRSYPYIASITLEFDPYLQADGANGKFVLYDAATYGTLGATILLDNAGAPITGTISAGSLSFGYIWSGNKDYVGVAIGKGNAKIAVSAGTITQSTSNKTTFVAGKERWYVNPV